ncbi:MAG: BamA/TamA family outer membrane protein [Gemmatimonadota bacterium]
MSERPGPRQRPCGAWVPHGTRLWRGALLVLALGMAAAPARAQETSVLLPADTAESLVAFFNRPGTIRLTGASRVGPGTELVGDVAVLGGPLALDGTVRGRLVVINGDLELGPDAHVTGAVTVVGGDVRGLEVARVEGPVRRYRQTLSFRYDDAGLAYLPPEEEPLLAAGSDFAFGHVDFLVGMRGSYNRVEGFPVALGPRVRFGGSNVTEVQALALYRSASGLDVDGGALGWDVAVEQYLGAGGTVRFGLGTHSEIVPIPGADLSDREASLATFVLHRDYRDHYEREGWRVWLAASRSGLPHTARLEYRNERHASMAARDPFALQKNDAAWRPEPIVAEGPLRSLGASYGYDTRNDAVDPSAGWLIDLGVEVGLAGDLQRPLVPPDAPAEQRFRFPGDESSYHAGLVDLRSYTRFNPYSRLAARLMAAGSLDGEPLPPQRQRSLGGEGSLPGYELFDFDCDARSTSLQIGDEPHFPAVGCDRVVLMQLEYQASFPMARRLVRSLNLPSGLGRSVRWAAFFGAGRAWSEQAGTDGRTRGSDDFSADAGLGLRIGRIGLYGAVPISGRGQGFNFFVRLRPRL